MTSIIRLKRSGVAGKVPGVGDIVLGEIAVNTFDGRVFFKKNNGGDAVLELTTKDILSAVAFSGSYNDLLNKPALKPVATTGAYSDLTGKPALAIVATSGDYNDLANKPAPASSIVPIANITLATATASFTYTGLSVYRRIRLRALMKVNSGGALRISCRTAGGTWRTLYTAGTASDNNNKVSSAYFDIEAFSQPTFKLFNGSADGSDDYMPYGLNTVYANGNAAQKDYIATFSEVWDELQLLCTSGSFNANSHLVVEGVKV